MGSPGISKDSCQQGMRWGVAPSYRDKLVPWGVPEAAAKVQVTCGCLWGLIAQSVSMGRGLFCTQQVWVPLATQAESTFGTLVRSTTVGLAGHQWGPEFQADRTAA